MEKEIIKEIFETTHRLLKEGKTLEAQRYLENLKMKYKKNEPHNDKHKGMEQSAT